MRWLEFQRAQASFETSLRAISASWTSVDEHVVIGNFETPETSRSIFILPQAAYTPKLHESVGQVHPYDIRDGVNTFADLPGGIYLVAKN